MSATGESVTGRWRRRDVARAAWAAALVCASRSADARAPGRVWRIGYLGPPADVGPQLLDAFRDGLRTLGYVDGRNIAIDYRWTTREGGQFLSPDELYGLAQELVARKVDVLAASVRPAILAARRASASVPIVMMNGTDPVESGLAASLAHPGGNVTGVTRLAAELIGKGFELLVEAVPRAKRIALLSNGAGVVESLVIANARQAAQARGIELQVLDVRAASDLPAAFATMKTGLAEGLLVTGDGLFFAQRTRIAELAIAQRLPTMVANTEVIEAGALLSYSSSNVENYRRAATFIDKILRGVPPGDIPIEGPTRFELALNMRTAKAIGVVFPHALVLRADRVVE